MFEIDLKRGSRHGESGGPLGDRWSEAKPWIPIAAGLVVLVAGLWLVSSRAEATAVERRASVLALDAEVVAKRQELASIAGQRGTIAVTSSKEIYWSDVLRLLSERMPDKLWISDVKVTTSTPPKDEPDAPVIRTLSVRGGVLSAASEGNLDVVAGFLESLQADGRYRESFGPPKLDSVTRGSEPHTLTFQVTIPFLPA